MVLNEDIPILDLFRESVDSARKALTKVEVRDELTYFRSTAFRSAH